MSKFKFFFPLTFVIAVIIVQVMPVMASTPNNGEILACNLPAPTGLQVTDISYNSIAVEWQAVPGAVAYYIEARDAGNNALYFSNTTTNLAENCTSLPSGTEINIYVKASCGGEEISSETAITSAKTDYVIDLIAHGYAPCERKIPITPVPTGNNGDIQFPFSANTVHEGHVSQYENVLSQFNLTFYPNSIPTPTAVYAEDQANTTAYIGNCAGAAYIIDDIFPPAGSIGQCSQSYAKMRVVSAGTTGNFLLVVEDMADGLNFEFSSCGQGGGRDGADGRANNDIFSSTEIKISPNPFNDFVNVQFNDYRQGEIAEISLLHTDGRIIKQLKHRVDSNQLISIDTDELQSGTYLLHIQTQYERKTQLIVKVD